MIKQVLHDAWARGVDGVSFGFINALQWRGRAGSHTAAEMEAYCRRWDGAVLEDYYAVPPGTDFVLPTEGGSHRLPSPWSSGCAENDHVHLDIWLGPKGWKSPVMFLLHGLMSVSDVGYRMWARTLNRLGWTAVFFHLPYHYGRRPAGAWSGEMAISSNLIRSAEGIRQAVVELRLVSQLLRERGAPHIGLWGTSYGGWVASLLAALEPGISTVWLLEPIVDADEVIWTSPASRTIRRQLKSRGISRELVLSHLPLVCPSYHVPLVAPERILLLAGVFDRVAPPATIRNLHEKWTGSHYAEFRQGHVGYQLMPQALRMAQELWPELFEGRRD